MSDDRFILRVSSDLLDGLHFMQLSDKAFRGYVYCRLLMAKNGMAGPGATCHVSLVNYAIGVGRGSRGALQELIDAGVIEVSHDGTVTFLRGAAAVMVQPNAGRKRQPISMSVRTRVFDRDGYKCIICASRELLTIDHIVPHSQGGSDEIANLRTLCGRCNTLRGPATYTDEELRALIADSESSVP